MWTRFFLLFAVSFHFICAHLKCFLRMKKKKTYPIMLTSVFPCRISLKVLGKIALEKLLANSLFPLNLQRLTFNASAMAIHPTRWFLLLSLLISIKITASWYVELGMISFHRKWHFDTSLTTSTHMMAVYSGVNWIRFLGTSMANFNHFFHHAINHVLIQR